MGLNDLAFGADGHGLYNLGLKDSGLNNRGADRPVTHTLTNSKHLDNYCVYHTNTRKKHGKLNYGNIASEAFCVIWGHGNSKYLQKVQGQKNWQEMEPYYINVSFAFTALIICSNTWLGCRQSASFCFHWFFRIDQGYLTSVWPPKTKDMHRWYPNRSSFSKIQSKRGWYWHFGRRKPSGMQGIDVNINKPDLCDFLFYLRESLPVPNRQWSNYILTMNANAAKPSKV